MPPVQRLRRGLRGRRGCLSYASSRRADAAAGIFRRIIFSMLSLYGIQAKEGGGNCSNKSHSTVSPRYCRNSNGLNARSGWKPSIGADRVAMSRRETDPDVSSINAASRTDLGAIWGAHSRVSQRITQIGKVFLVYRFNDRCSSVIIDSSRSDSGIVAASVCDGNIHLQHC